MSKRHPSVERFHEAVDGIRELFEKKNRDYGLEHDPFANVRSSEKWGVKPHIGAMMRLNDKVVRLQTYARTGTLANEGVEDSLRDIAVYALIALCLFEEEEAA